ncbi:MAG: hypothetical protein RL719_919 [Actinomycetota bacterium]
MILTGFALLVLVGVAGGLGSVIRYRLGNRPGTWLPWGTLLANTLATIIGAAAVSVLDVRGDLSTVFGENFDLGTASAYVLITGLAGGLSTFSTVAGQVAELLKARLWLRAVVYGLGSFVIPSTAALLVGILL